MDINTCKNKWNSQQVHKRFKNCHSHSDSRGNYKYYGGDKRSSTTSAWYEIDSHLIEREEEEYDIGFEEEEYENEITQNMIWDCPRCTYQNEDTSYCLICDLSLHASDEKNIVLGDYLDPILDKMNDDNDESLQVAIASSLQQQHQHQLTDSDDTDDTLLTIKNTKKRKKKHSKKSMSFATYWQEMNDHYKYLQKNLKYITKQNELRSKKEAKKSKQFMNGYGHINACAYAILQKNEHLVHLMPTIKQIQNWLQQRWDITDFSIKNICTAFVLNKFLKHGSLSNVQVVYHGTGSYNNESIIQNGLITGGTKGVGITNGAVHGRGIYCSPSVELAGYYQRGSLFVCLVRANGCKKSGSIYVVKNDDDILPVYLASFKASSYCYYGNSMPSNILMSFVPGWKPLNVNEKANKDRRVKRKWSAYYKLAEK